MNELESTAVVEAINMLREFLAWHPGKPAFRDGDDLCGEHVYNVGSGCVSTPKGFIEIGNLPVPDHFVSSLGVDVSAGAGRDEQALRQALTKAFDDFKALKRRLEEL